MPADPLELIDYSLPDRLIAQTPLADRSASRLMVVHRKSGKIEHRRFLDCFEYLAPGDTLVLNETYVTARRLMGHRQSEGSGRVEALLLRRVDETAFECLCRPAKRLRTGAVILFDGGLKASVEVLLPEGARIIRFEGASDLDQRIEAASTAATPPYIHQPLADKERYQTVYADRAHAGGSAAAPTAGLHFTGAVLNQIQSAGISLAKVNLTVGLDTFRPIKAASPAEHEMHGETCSISPAAADTIEKTQGRLVAVGTTSVRTLETFARMPDAHGRSLPPGSTVSKLFLYPGEGFRIVDAMFTNFHMPRTTMLLMLAAFAGPELVKAAYEEAIREEYRFLSFGDSMLLTD